MQLLTNLVTILVLATCLPLVRSLTPLPKAALTTPDQLFNCTSYRSNFCIGVKNKVPSINDQGCIKDQNCDVLVHVYRSQDYFTFHYACARPDCVIIFLLYYEQKVDLYHRNTITSFEEAKSSIPNVPYAEIDLKTGKESINYYRKILLYLTPLNGWGHLRPDTNLTIRSHTVGRGGRNREPITYKIGERTEKNDPSYDFDVNPFSIVLIHSVNNTVENLVDGVDPVVLFSQDVQEKFKTSQGNKLVGIGSRMVLIMATFTCALNYSLYYKI